MTMDTLNILDHDTGLMQIDAACLLKVCPVVVHQSEGILAQLAHVVTVTTHPNGLDASTRRDLGAWARLALRSCTKACYICFGTG